MLNPELKLNPKIFDEDIEQKPIRDGYSDALVELGEKNPDVVVLTADLAESTRAHKFAEKFPERFIECGVAEQNMAGIAAGLGVSGKIAFISSYATFSPGKNWETIRTTIIYNDSNVKIAGHHSGIVTGPDGATHQATEDIAIMRCLPNVRIISPCDFWEAKKATLYSAEVYGPFYIRYVRDKTPIITTEETPFRFGKIEEFWIPNTDHTRTIHGQNRQNNKSEQSESSPNQSVLSPNKSVSSPNKSVSMQNNADKNIVAIFATGHLVYQALLAAKELEEEGIDVYVLNVHTIKPLDVEKIFEIAKKVRGIVTLEDHQVQGGMGSAISEALMNIDFQKQYGLFSVPPIKFLGLQNTFGESGKPNELIQKYGMDKEAVKKAVYEFLK
ncbi:1-deoxy-D-xylulose-5-phosphate synthase [bacterium HR35]|nr:1-deoxy-D-xylulose-5-phosphate synthase [bacterium HR35]